MAPTQTVTLACEWLPYVRGALQQLLLQATWDTGSPAELLLAQEWAFGLIDLFQECGGGSLPFSCPYDFSAGGAETDGYVTPDNAGYAPSTLGMFLPGTGWVSTDSILVGYDIHINAVHIVKNFLSPVNMDRFLVTFNLAKGSVGGGIYDFVEASYLGSTVFDQSALSNSVPDGINAWGGSGAAHLVDKIEVRIIAGDDVGGPPGGTAQILRIDYNLSGGGCVSSE